MHLLANASPGGSSFLKHFFGWTLGFLFFASPGLGRSTAAEPIIPPVLLQMARDSSIHEELGLSSEQKAAFLEATDAIDPILWPSRILPAEKQLELNDQLTSQLWARLIAIADAEQRERLTQLRRQAVGTRMFLLPEMADAIKLSRDVRQQIRDLAIETDVEVAAAQKKLTSGGDAKEINADLQKVRQREQKGIVDLLSLKQQQLVGTMVGAPFDFSKVKRAHPRAPEFVAGPGQWLQGKPLKMSELRGKVVVIHFYAFQCINCRRNLPHYNGWFDDFSADDVVVIGIQTPETSAERDPSKITSAIASEKMSYPVLFDQNSENWKAWGNTMWPTVYLVDRDGFIRTWWQGELNWQGGTGEQQYREFIRQLVAEVPAS